MITQVFYYKGDYYTKLSTIDDQKFVNLDGSSLIKNKLPVDDSTRTFINVFKGSYIYSWDEYKFNNYHVYISLDDYEITKRLVCTDQDIFKIGFEYEFYTVEESGNDYMDNVLNKQLHDFVYLYHSLVDGYHCECGRNQHEIQVSGNGFEAAYKLILAKYILNYRAKLNINDRPKSFKQLPGSSLHCNISFANKEPDIKTWMHRLKYNHDYFIEILGVENRERLTGEHETSKYDKFTQGQQGDRTASVMIKKNLNTGAEYIEDRRPGANMCPLDLLIYYYRLLLNKY